MEVFNEIISWTNRNSGFLSLLLFVSTIIYGWASGLISSLIKKPKLKVRFIPKMSFYSFYYTGDKWFNEQLKEEFELHKTGFVVYMSIANLGNKPTSIDKVSLGYYKNDPKKSHSKKNMEWINQMHPADDFGIELSNGDEILVPNLRVRNRYFVNSTDSYIGIGSSLTGIAYFEQFKAWGNLNPKEFEEGQIKVVIRIIDTYGLTYDFDTSLKHISIEKARKHNPHFGNVEELTIK